MTRLASRPVPILGRLSLALLLTLVAACASAPPVRRARPPAPVAAATALPKAKRQAAAKSATPLVEESDIGDASGLTGPERHGPATAGQDQLAAVPPSGARQDVPPPPSIIEPESLAGRITSTTPPNVAAAMRLIEDGRQQMTQRRYDQALERFERSVAIDPSNAYGYYFLAKLNYVMKKYDQASAFAGRATQLVPRGDHVWLARAYSLQGAVYEEVGRYADARRAYQKAASTDANNLAARAGMARLSPGETSR